MSLGDQVPQTISGDHIVSHSRSQDHCPPAKPTLESISIIIGCAPSARFSLSTRIRICMLTIIYSAVFTLLRGLGNL